MLMKYGMMTMDIQISGIHNFGISLEYGDWRISEIPRDLHLYDIIHLLNSTELVQHSEIGWKGMHLPSDFSTIHCLCCNGQRYENCDIAYPGILVKNAPNPYNKKYRMIDGKHRMAKMRKMGITQSKFYVLDFDQITDFIK